MVKGALKMLRREVPTWLFFIVLVLVVVIVGMIGWQIFRPKGRRPVSPTEAREKARLIERRIQQAGEGKIPEGMKPVPSPYSQGGQE